MIDIDGGREQSEPVWRAWQLFSICNPTNYPLWRLSIIKLTWNSRIVSVTRAGATYDIDRNLLNVVKHSQMYCVACACFNVVVTVELKSLHRMSHYVYWAV